MPCNVYWLSGPNVQKPPRSPYTEIVWEPLKRPFPQNGLQTPPSCRPIARSHFLPPRDQPTGVRTLAEYAIHTACLNIAALGPESLQHVPWHIARRIYHGLNQYAPFRRLRVWQVFALAYHDDATAVRELDFPSFTLDYSFDSNPNPAIPSDFPWLADLSVTRTVDDVSQIVEIGQKFPNLRRLILDISEHEAYGGAVDGASRTAIDRRLFHVISLQNTEGRAFHHLQRLKVCLCSQIAPAICCTSVSGMPVLDTVILRTTLPPCSEPIPSLGMDDRTRWLLAHVGPYFPFSEHEEDFGPREVVECGIEWRLASVPLRIYAGPACPTQDFYKRTQFYFGDDRMPRFNQLADTPSLTAQLRLITGANDEHLQNEGYHICFVRADPGGAARIWRDRLAADQAEQTPFSPVLASSKTRGKPDQGNHAEGKLAPGSRSRDSKAKHQPTKGARRQKQSKPVKQTLAELGI